MTRCLIFSVVMLGCATPWEQYKAATGRRDRSAYGVALARCDQADYFPSIRRDAAGRVLSGVELACWAGATLHGMGEPKLQPGTRRVYRFLWLRSFHPDVAVRIERYPSSAFATAVTLEFDGTVTARRTFATSDESFDRVDALLARAGFWDGAPSSQAGEVIDGAYWILEGTADGRHSAEQLYSSDVFPGQGSEAPPSPENVAFREAALLLLELAGMKPSAAQIY